MDEIEFHYRPACSTPDCHNEPLFKVAAAWSDGTSRELKHYGLACLEHRDAQLIRAQLHRESLVVAEGETVGPVGLYELVSGRRDIDLRRLPDGQARD